MERVRFLEHRGQKVLLIDFRQLDPGQMLAVVDRVRQIIKNLDPALQRRARI